MGISRTAKDGVVVVALENAEMGSLGQLEIEMEAKGRLEHWLTQISTALYTWPCFQQTIMKVFIRSQRLSLFRIPMSVRVRKTVPLHSIFLAS